MEEHVQLVEWLSLAMEPSEALDMLACMAAHREGDGNGRGREHTCNKDSPW